jgi:hypoxanthine phosphoribosyltransferase
MSKKYYDWKKVEGMCIELARQISSSGFNPDYIVGITRGGLVPAVLLSQNLNKPLHTIKVSFRDNEGCESVTWMAEDAFGYNTDPECLFQNKSDPEQKLKILIVDDINDKGTTINWIKQDWQSSCLPTHPAWNKVWGENVRIAVLTHNTASKADVDYFSTVVNKFEDDVWIVYPWEQFWLTQN